MGIEKKVDKANDKRPKKKEVINLNLKLTAEEAEKEEFSLRLESLRSALDHIDKINKLNLDLSGPKMELSEEMFKQIMQTSFDEFKSYVEGGKIITDKDTRSLHEQVSGIINGEFNQEYTGNKLRELMKKASARVLATAICLYLKFGVSVQAQELKVEEKRMVPTEESYNYKMGGGGGGDGDDGGDGGNPEKLKTNPEEAKNLKESSSFDVTQSFETDKAYISPLEAQKITEDIHTFLGTIKADNYEAFIKTSKKVLVSSDQRATRYNHSGDPKNELNVKNNKALSEDRAEQLIKIIKAAFQSYTYPNLSNEEAEAIKNLQIEVKIPKDGYTPITSLYKIDPLTQKMTNEKYSAKDVEEMKLKNKTLYEKLLKECRYAQINLMAELESLEKMPKHERAIIFGDLSPSMNLNFKNAANTLAKIAENIPAGADLTKVDLVYFDDKLAKVEHLSSIAEAAASLRDQIIPSEEAKVEKPFAACVNYLTTVINNDKEILKNGGTVETTRVAYFATDEGLQDIENIYEAISKLEEAKVDVAGGDAIMLMYSKGSDTPVEIKLIDLKNSLEMAIKVKMTEEVKIFNEEKETLQKSADKVARNLIENISSQERLSELLGLDKNKKIELSEDEMVKILINKAMSLPDLKVRLFNTDQFDKIKGKNLKDYDLVTDLLSQKKILKQLATKELNSGSAQDYLNRHKIQIKTITDNLGNKIDFDISARFQVLFDKYGKPYKTEKIIDPKTQYVEL